MPSQILSTFDNGRVEAFLDMRTLTPEDMTHPAMAVRIARRLKQFHNAPITTHDSKVGKAEPFSTLWKWCAELFFIPEGCGTLDSFSEILMASCVPG